MSLLVGARPYPITFPAMSPSPRIYPSIFWRELMSLRTVCGLCLSRPRINTSLLVGILEIFTSRTEEQVLRIHALANVAPMKHPESFWHRTKMFFPRVAMRAQANLSRFVERAISTRVNVANPEPAALGFIDAAPEALIRRPIPIFREFHGSIIQTMRGFCKGKLTIAKRME